MFTGIIKAKASLEKVEFMAQDGQQAQGAVITLKAGDIVADLEQGGSLAVNGVCLTARNSKRHAEGIFEAALMGETLRRTTLASLAPGSTVNVERCLSSQGRFDGHLVQGHVDGLGRVSALEDFTSWRRLRIELDQQLAPLVAAQGSIAVDGVSLTVSAVSPAHQLPAWFEVSLIAQTMAATNLATLKPADTVNLELDLLARYTQRMLDWSQKPETTTADLAQENRVDQAVAALARGQAIVVVDAADRENEGDLVFAAEAATVDLLALTIRYTSGVICAPMPAARADLLGLEAMVKVNKDPKGTAYTVSCDAASGVTTGISGADRAQTLRVLADPKSDQDCLTRPGHIFPLRAHPDGIAGRAGHTEAAVELCQLAGFSGVAAIAELVRDDGSMMRQKDLATFAQEQGLVMISIAALQKWMEQR